MKSTSSDKEILFSVTDKDFDWKYSRGTGKGGQKRNKTESHVRCVHRDSGAVGESDETRSKHSNRVLAWRKCIETKVFKSWHRLETAKQLGALKDIDEKVQTEMRKIRVDVKDEEGRWIDEKHDGVSDNGC